MKTPKRIEPLIEDGLVDEVLRPLMSGKEAAVYVVRCGNELRCAKVYKEANKRSFRQAAEYQEGRKVRNSRQARAMAKGSKFGRKETEDAWQNAEVAALFRLAGAGVRVPKPYDFLEGVLLMELVADEYGDAAPRLNDVVLEPDQAREYHAFLIEQIVLMLCAGLVHGDLSSSTCCWRLPVRSSSTCRKRSMPRATTTRSACWSATSATWRCTSAASRRSSENQVRQGNVVVLRGRHLVACHGADR